MRRLFFSSLFAAMCLTATVEGQLGGAKPAAFPCKPGLEAKWQASLERPLTPEAAAAFFRQDADGANLIPAGDARHRSLWSAVHMRLAGQEKVVEALRDLKAGRFDGAAVLIP